MLTIRPRRLDHHRRGEVRGERGRAQAAGEHQVPVAPLHLPERGLVVERELVAAPRVVDEQVEPAVVSLDPLEEPLYLSVLRVVASDRDPGAAALRHLVGGVVDGAGPVEGRRLAADAPPSDVDGGALLAKHERDPLPATAASPGDERDAIL